MYVLGVTIPHDMPSLASKATEAERALVERARAGDAAAVDELLRQHERQIYRFGLRMCGNEDSAREVLQETLLAAFRHLSSYRQEAALSTWLYQIARSMCLKQRRTKVGQPSVLGDAASAEARAVEAPQSSVENRAHAKEVADLVTAAIASLPGELKETLVLRDVEGLSAEETCDVVGISLPAMKSRLHRARAALNERVNAVLGENAQALHLCPAFTRELAELNEKDIDQSVCERLENHLRTCRQCAEANAGLERTVSVCRALPDQDLPSAVKAAVRSLIREAAAQKPVP